MQKVMDSTDITSRAAQGGPMESQVSRFTGLHSSCKHVMKLNAFGRAASVTCVTISGCGHSTTFVALTLASEVSLFYPSHKARET
jgi:hypothetical protein